MGIAHTQNIKIANIDRARNMNLILLSFTLKFLNFKENKGISAIKSNENRIVKGMIK